MKFTLRWLREHLETEAELACITDTLSLIGLEVDGVQDPAAALAPFRTARVVEAVQHPNADRLRVCRVETGEGEFVTVVCGAPNVRSGMKGVFAPPGTFIPGTGITLKVGEIRGVTSAGMLVSARELGLSEEHEGIVELPEDAPVGESYAAWAQLDDPVIEVGVTPNRGDALGVRGIARDLAAAGLGHLKPWAPAAVQAAFATPISWRNEWPEACPWVLGRSIRNLTNGPSPDWLQRRLLAIGLRPISALVDVTNFFTFDLGRPLHVFDADEIAGDALIFRRGGHVAFAALNGRSVTPSAEDLEIADAQGPVSLAGVIGGETTGTSAATRHVFLECALFDPVRIALTGRRHGIATDARQRFERGVDQALLPAAVEAATQMILALCGGEAGTVVSAGGEPAWEREAALRFRQVKTFGGVETTEAEVAAILARLGFHEKSRDSERIVVAVPSWRNDVAAGSAVVQPANLDPVRGAAARTGAEMVEAECDLLEEVLRIFGLHRVTPVSMPALSAVPQASLTPQQSRAALARRLLASRGLAECVTYSFGADAEMAAFGAAPATLLLRNPIAADLDRMRPTPLATLAAASRQNLARGAGHVALFEIGPGFQEGGEAPMAAGLRAGEAQRHWQVQAAFSGPLVSKADLYALLAALGVPMEALSVTRDAPAHYHPGQSGTVRQGPKTVMGWFGALHPALAERLGLTDASAFELNLGAIADPKRRRRAALVLSPFQPVSRDFAFVVADDVSAETILRAVRSAHRTGLSKVGIFDIFTGGTLPPGQKSVGVEVVFQPREHTFTDLEIEAACSAVVRAVTEATGASLR